MIDKIGSKVYVFCDVCGCKSCGFGNIQDAVADVKNNGWEAKKIDGEWDNICEDCMND
jgi:hypothetical protein